MVVHCKKWLHKLHPSWKDFLFSTCLHLSFQKEVPSISPSFESGSDVWQRCDTDEIIRPRQGPKRLPCFGFGQLIPVARNTRQPAWAPEGSRGTQGELGPHSQKPAHTTRGERGHPRVPSPTFPPAKCGCVSELTGSHHMAPSQHRAMSSSRSCSVWGDIGRVGGFCTSFYCIMSLPEIVGCWNWASSNC